jgi:hypothetical protein
VNKKIDALTTKLSDLKTAVDKQLTTPNNGASRDLQVGATPQEELDDRQAYRSGLYADWEAARLDGSHDLNGNALYRLQMQANVAPGKIKNRYGVALVTLEHEQLSQDAINDLYLEWLASINADLNAVPDQGRMPKEQYYALASGTGLYEIMDIPFGGDTCKAARTAGLSAPVDSSCAVLPVAVPAADAAFIRNYLSDVDGWDARFQAVRKFFDKVRGGVSTPDDVKAYLLLAQNQPESQFPADAEPKITDACHGELVRAKGFKDPSVKLAQLLALQSIQFTGDGTMTLYEFQRNVQRISAIGKLVGAVRFQRADEGMAFVKADGAPLTGDNLKTALRDYHIVTGGLTEWSEIGDEFVNLVNMVNAVEHTGCKLQRRSEFTPRPFYEAVAEDRSQANNFVYSTAPRQLAQRVSTVTSATEALQLIGALSASLPTSGVSVDAAADYMHSATGRADALESLPLVIGFSDASPIAPKKPEADAKLEAAQALSFGWLFGPKAVVNPENHTMELRQVPTNQRVTADISIPGWWKEVKITTNAAWVKNFYDGSITPDVIKVGRPQTYTKSIPNAQRMENLTDYMSSVVWGQEARAAAIYSVEPHDLSTCAQSASFIIRGPNLWRNGEVYLNGRPANDPVHVLPDMRGIVADFNLAGLFPTPAPATAKLQVFTQLGGADSEVNLQSADCGQAGEGQVLNVDVQSPPAAALGGSYTLVSPSAWPNGATFKVKIFPEGQSKNAGQTTDMISATPTGRELKVKMPATLTGSPPSEGGKYAGAVFAATGDETKRIAEFGPLYLYSAADEGSPKLSVKPGTRKATDWPNIGVHVVVDLPAAYGDVHKNSAGATLKLIVTDQYGKAYGEPLPIDTSVSVLNKRAKAQSDLTLKAGDVTDLLKQGDTVPLTLTLVDANGQAVDGGPATVQVTLTKN